MTATKTNCTGTVVLAGGQVTNPATPGIYVITWSNDSGSGSVVITDDDQVTVSGNVDPVITFNVGTQTVLVDTQGPRACCDGAGNATLNTAISVPQGATNTSTATLAQRTQLAVFTFHRSNGTPIILDPALYEVRVTPASSAITWTPAVYPPPAGQSTLPFSGTLIRPTTAAGMIDINFSVVEKASAFM